MTCCSIMSAAAMKRVLMPWLTAVTQTDGQVAFVDATGT